MNNFETILTEYVIPILGSALIFLVFLLVANRLTYEYYKFRIHVARAKVDIFLTQIAFNPLDENEIARSIKNFKKRIPFSNRWCKEVVLNEIINLKQNVKGEIEQDIHFIYEQFNLYKYTLSFLNSSRWYVKSLGFYHLQALEYSKGIGYVKPFVDSRNPILSSNAHMALVSLEPENLDHIGRYSYAITTTDEIKIMDIVHSVKPPMPENLKMWLKSPNASVVKLGVRLMVHYNLTSESKALLEVLKSPHEAVRHEAIVAFKVLFIMDAESDLIAQFDLETKANKIEILQTLATVGDKKSLEFLNNLLGQEIDNYIKLEAVCSINKINPDFFNRTFPKQEEVSRMVKHVKDPYL